MKQIGTVQILRERVCSLDPETPEPRAGAVVPPGNYPVYGDGYSTLWVMEGFLNFGGLRRVGDGMMIGLTTDIKSDIPVRFPSRMFGPDEFAELLKAPIAIEGHTEQRLRFNIESPTTSEQP